MTLCGADRKVCQGGHISKALGASDNEGMRRSLLVLLYCSLVPTLTGCGVKQFNGKVIRSNRNARSISVYGPYYASGQNGESSTAATCTTGLARPCAKLRGSAGIPHHFDNNSNDVASPVLVGTTTTPGVYVTTLGAGKTGAVNQHLKNKDLELMKRQAGALDEVF